MLQDFHTDGGRPLGLGRGGKSGTLLVVPTSLYSAANARQDVDLQLSGHTHGGHAPGLSALVALFNHGYVRGWYRVEGMPLYVSSGAGLWNGFPLRVDVPSEIALITLRRGPAGAASAGSRM